MRRFPPPTHTPCSPAPQNVLLQGNCTKLSLQKRKRWCHLPGVVGAVGAPRFVLHPVSSCTLWPCLGRAAFPRPGTASTSPWGAPWVQHPSPGCCSFATPSRLCKAPWGSGTPRRWACDRPGGGQHPSGTPPSCFLPLCAQFGVSHVLPHQVPAIVTVSPGTGPFLTPGLSPGADSRVLGRIWLGEHVVP